MDLRDDIDRVRGRRARRALRFSVLGGLLAIALAGVPLYVAPPQHLPAHADVVFVLGAPEPWQIAWAEQLVRTGRADSLMISTPPNVETPSTCRQTGVLCLRPDPSSTRGEAQMLRRQMSTHGWSSAIVLTTTPHITRTRLILGQCLTAAADADVSVIGRSTGMSVGDWIEQYLHQTAGFAKAIAFPGC